MNKIKKFLLINWEGILVGSLWGIMSLYASLGMASLPSLNLFHKLLILPTVIGGFLAPGDNAWVGLITVTLVGASIGMVVDMIYKPKQ